MATKTKALKAQKTPSSKKATKKAAKKATAKGTTKGTKTPKKTARKTDKMLAFFKDGEPDDITMLNEVRPLALKGLRSLVLDGTKIEDVLKTAKAKLKECKKGTPEHRKYLYLLSITQEVIETRDKAKAGDEFSKMKLINWKFITVGRPNGNKED